MSNYFLNDSRTMSVAYLEMLNPEQRQAVEHGVWEKACAPAAPLLVIAGAGSGTMNTLANLIVNGADPRRILLMTFSRRAATGMTRRVERIARQVIGDRAGVITETLTWAGTFHGIGARHNVRSSIELPREDERGVDSALQDLAGQAFVGRRPGQLQRSHHHGENPDRSLPPRVLIACLKVR